MHTYPTVLQIRVNHFYETKSSFWKLVYPLRVARNRYFDDSQQQSQWKLNSLEVPLWSFDVSSFKLYSGFSWSQYRFHVITFNPNKLLPSFVTSIAWNGSRIFDRLLRELWISRVIPQLSCCSDYQRMSWRWTTKQTVLISAVTHIVNPRIFFLWGRDSFL